jgi:membrane protein implicated in regulation of membrane protease activity
MRGATPGGDGRRAGGGAMDILWWHWCVLGIALMIGELAVPAFFLIWFGAAAVIVGVLLALFPQLPFSWQVILWTALSVASIWLWFKVFRRGYHKTRVGFSRGTFIGEIGLVIQDIRPFDKGRIRFQKPILGDETWESIADEEIRTGERVKVLDVEGNILKVGRV